MEAIEQYEDSALQAPPPMEPPRRKRKGDAAGGPKLAKPPKEPPTLAAAIPDVPTSPPPPSSAPSSSLPFAVALAQAKRDEDRRKDAESSDDEGKEGKKESKEERRKRKEEKRRRKEEKAKRREEAGGERKRKHKGEGEDGKKSKKHKRGEGEGEADAEQHVTADFSKAVESFMAASPVREKKKKSKGADAEAAPTRKEKGKAPADSHSSPSPSSTSTPSREPMEPMDASSPELERDPMDASSPAATPARPPRVRASVSKTGSPTPPLKVAPPKEGETSEAAAAKLTKSASGAKSKTPRKKKEPEPADEAEDEALRERLKDPAAAQEFLSSGWVDIPVLLRLEKKGIITWKRGKYTESEKAAVRRTLETFARTHALSDQELIDIIFAKGRSSARSKYPGFWADVAAAVPGRPLRYVKEAVQRMYHPNAHKGPWTKEEDADLQRAYTENPGQWVKIGEAVGRSYTDCRDRYKKQLEVSKERISGRWTKQEEEQLKKAVKKATEDLGRDMFDGDIPWTVVAQLMDGYRSFHQCRVKWQESMVPMLTGEGYNAGARDVLEAMRKFGYEHEKDIVWRDISNHAKSHAKGAQATWRRMLAAVAPVEDKSFKEILDMMEANLDDIIAQEVELVPMRVKKAKEAPKPIDRRERLAAARGESGWLEAAALGEQAEAWMDSVVASGRDRSVSARSGSDEARSRKVSFEGGE